MTTKTTTTHDSHHGIQKVCPCGRSRWSKCPHSWYLRWTPPGGRRLQIKIDAYVGVHVDLKSDAERLVIEIKAKVLAGTFSLGPSTPPTRPGTPPAGSMTVAQLGEHFFANGPKNEKTGKPLKPRERENWNRLCATTIVRPTTKETTTIGAIAAAHLTSFDIEAFRAANASVREVVITDKRGRQYPGRRGGTVATNRTVGRWRAIYTWGVLSGYIEQTPFLKGGVPIIKHYGEGTRSRRLEEGQRAQLLQHAGNQDVRDLFECAIDTCCRKGELLELRWYQVRWQTNEIALEGKQTKNGKPRRIPMCARVRTILERRRLDPDGEPYGPMRYVFGDVTGQKRGDLKAAWATMRLKAAGFVGPLRDPKKRALTPEARAALKAIDLRWHDLRREGASGNIDHGMDVRAVQVLLDHANIATTQRYLALSQQALHQEFERVEARKQAALVCAGIATAGSGEAKVEAAAAGGAKLKVG